MIDFAPGRTRECLHAARSVLADGQRQLRRLTQAPMGADWGGELQSAAEALATVKVALIVDDSITSHDVVTWETSQLQAAVLREAVTNALKHSDVRRCLVRRRLQRSECLLEIVSIGAHRPQPGVGSGLSSLAQRAERVGGRLSHTASGESRYVVSLWTPWSRD